jgi:hypothetical protein
MIKTRHIGFMAAAVAALSAPTSASAVEYTEAHVYGIANFGGAGQCGSTGQTHAVHTDTAAAFLSTFTSLQATGEWDEAFTRNNANARGSYFTDPARAATCACTAADATADYGADDADVIYVHTHGGHTASATSGVYRSWILGGDSSYACSPSTDQNMRFGDTAGGGDLGIAVIKACQTGDYDVWQNGGYRQRFSTTDGSFRVWNAFHGDSSCGGHVTTYVGSYSAESTYEGVGENWLDEAYDDDAGADNDDCPVSIVMGASRSQRENMYEHGGWLDRKATGDKTGSTYWYFASCDPAHGVALPSN